VFNPAGIPLSQHRFFWLLIALVGLAMEGFALFSQHVWGFQPCNECIYIRVGVAGLILAGMIGATAPRLRLVRATALVATAVSLSWALYRAFLLVALEQKVSDGAAAGCSRFKGFPAWASLDTWFPAVFEPRGTCGEIVGVFLGWSFAYWSLLGLVLVGGVFGGLTLLVQSPRKPAPLP
jgi:disulfide bond formation protein DsbB